MKTLTALLTCLFASGLFAEEPPPVEKPGEHHRHLKLMAGTWDVKSKLFVAPGQIIEGSYVEKARIQPGGFWLISNLSGKAMGMPFHGHAVLGYEAHKKQYSGVWVDSFVSVLVRSTGHCKNDGKLNVMTGKGYDPIRKRTVTMRQITEIKDANTKIFRMFTVDGDQETLTMEAIYKRQTPSGDKK